MKKIKKLIHYFFALKKLYKKNKTRKFPIKRKDKIDAIKNGFLPESNVIYDFKKTNSKDFVSDFSRAYEISNINGRNSLILDSKLLFASCFINDKAVVPLFYINKQKIITFGNGTVVSIEQLLNIIKNGKELVFKPDGGGGGSGINFIKFQNDKWFVNEELKKINEIEKLISLMNINLVYERIQQTGFASKVYPDSLNTIRILTMVDPITNTPFICSSVFRCGTSFTKGVDNWSSGGLSANINLKTGTLGKAVAFPNGNKLNWVVKHPDTNFKIEGFSIPNWNAIASEVLAISQKYFYLPYIGWDIITMEDDFKILEANSNSDLNLLQVHHPFLTNSKVKDFYNYYKRK